MKLRKSLSLEAISQDLFGKDFQDLSFKEITEALNEVDRREEMNQTAFEISDTVYDEVMSI